MAADDVPGPRKQPRFKGTGAPATAADLNTLGDYAALVGNRKVGTTAERTAATAAGEVWPGLRWKDTTIGRELEFVDGSVGWIRAEPNRGVWSQDTDTSGFASVGHGLGYTPTSVQITNGPVSGLADANTRLFTPVIWDIGPSLIRVRFRREDNNTWVSEAQAVRFHWEAI